MKVRDVALGMGIDVVLENGRCAMPALPKETIAEINRQLVMKGIDIYEVSVVKNDLERIFMDMIG